MKDDNLVFVNKSSRVSNIGDVLCSPRHYYNFSVSPGAKVAIIGGGAFNDLGVSDAEQRPDWKTVLWGVGRSLNLPKLRIPFFAPSEIRRRLNEWNAARHHDAASVRDLEWARHGLQFVPCPSVHHPIASTPVGDSLGIYLNANPVVSGALAAERLKGFRQRHPDVEIGTNADDLGKFSESFAKTRDVITNSYHVAYWSLLSGRRVKVLGHSSKFTSLIRIFRLPAKDVFYYSAGSDGLGIALEIAEQSKKWLVRENYAKFVLEFKALNDAFAEMLVAKRIFEKIDHKQ